MKNIFIRIILLFLIFNFGIYYLGWKVDQDKNVNNGQQIKKRFNMGYSLLKEEYLALTKQRCAKPLKYSIGKIDDRFGLSKKDLLDKLKKAENIWESEIGTNLFEYDSKAKLKINLIYDQRQERIVARKNLDKSLKEINAIHQNIDEKYKQLVAEYNQKEKSYLKAVNKLNEDIFAYEKKVIKYNYNLEENKKTEKKLKKEKAFLEERRKVLISMENYLNNLATKINQLANRDNKLALDYNDKVNRFKIKYNFRKGQVFEEGEYKNDLQNKEINIYSFQDDSNLILTLAHELGHALGINHVSNKQSLMYYLNEKQNLENIKLTREDIEALHQVCDLKNIK